MVLRPQKPVIAISLCLMASLWLGCGDDDGGNNNNNNNDNTAQDGGVDAAPDAATGDSLTIVFWARSNEDATSVIAEGAFVAFDPPGGERQEATVGADGRLTFHGIDWTAGDANVTAFLFGYVIKSVVGLNPTWIEELGATPSELDLTLEPPAPADPPWMVQVSGTATGLVDPAHDYIVHVFGDLLATDEWGGPGSQPWSINVPTGVSFIIQALEQEYTELANGRGYERPIYRVMHMEHGPVTGYTTGVELDFGAYEMATFTADVSMSYPPRADSPLHQGDPPGCATCAWNTHFCQGWPTYQELSTDASQVDLSMVWVEPVSAELPFWFCSVTAGEVYSYTIVPGYPQPDDQASLIDVPRWITQSSPSAPHPVHDPLEWEWFETGLSYSSLSVTRDGNTVWTVIGHDSSSITIPAAPSVVDEAQLLGPTPMVRVFGGVQTPERFWERYAQNEPIPLQH